MQVECDDVFIATIDGQVPVVEAGDHPRMVTLDVNTVPVQFKIDTGADVSVVSELTFRELNGVAFQCVANSQVS